MTLRRRISIPSHGPVPALAASVLLALLVILPLAAIDAQAGDIDTNRTAACDVRFSGEIEQGDADRLIAALNAVDNKMPPAPRPQIETEIGYWSGIFIPRLCLDSQGGVFTEAVKFLKGTLYSVSFASVVEPLAECYSACALIFLGGHLNSGDGYFEQYRRLDTTAQLGFHAPYVAPAATEIVDPEVVGRSYRNGVEAVADLLDLNDELFPRSLLAEFLRVGADEFFRIDQVGQLAAWKIGLTGYRRPNAMTEKQIEYVCNNQRMRDVPQIYQEFASADEEPEQDSPAIPLSEKMAVRGEETIEGVAGCTVRARLYGGVLFLDAETQGVDAGNFEVQNDGEGDIITAAAVAENIAAVDPDGYTPAFFLFHPSTKIRTLKGRASPPAQPSAASTRDSTEALGHASLWDHNGSTMRLEKNAGTLSMTYENPRKGMRQVGVRKGDNLFTCSRDGDGLSCVSRIFHPRCGRHDFPAQVELSGDGKSIRIQGEAPGFDSACQQTSSKPQDWAFTYLSPAP
ncbi:hypothetical protein SAMN04488498_111163 [Mesorhizobium albiziae]|uniref:Uncharacterized protein n=1 Tax=Neomesorhizobium albiziae TaxID=335020 RepID=A0A1I4C0C8_9HYPH|nr:hypothetical protein [Mesorhizobium albiziae]GLS29571.1 hypothetical protein GCM10007937_12790 [Mesorhizobium albiziae]SFK74528.1 hypothetical protein SAMN04488498_111163 [Mesorhizobium albiziae]